jgi:hypothetical protein
MNYNVFDLTIDYSIMNNNRSTIYPSGVVTPSIMNFKFCKENLY